MLKPNTRTTIAALSAMQALTLAAPALSQTQTPSGTATPSTAPATGKVLPEVNVTAPARSTADTASVGGFGDAPLQRTPASISVFTVEQMQDLGIRSTTDLSRYDASLNESYNAIGYAEQFSIRGFALDNTASYRKDGLVISTDAPVPLENKERVEVLKGLAGLQAGIATPGGILNYVTKRPTDAPLRSIMFGASERGTLYTATDLGGRSDDGRFGYRINAAAEKLRSYVRGADGDRQFISGAFDWRLSPQALLQLDLDYQHRSQLTASGYQLIDGVSLPTGISARTMLGRQAWSRPVKADSANIGLRFAYQLNTDWNLSLAANRHRFKRDDYAAFPYGCTSAGLFPGFCANGDFDVYDYQSENESRSLLNTQAILRGKLMTGAVQHMLTFGVDAVRRRDYFGDCVYGAIDCLGSVPNGTSNLYAPVAVPASTISTGPILLRRKGDERSLFVQDIIGLTRTLDLHAGVRYTAIERDQFDATGSLSTRYDRHYALPNVALVFTPQQALSLYGSYAQGLEHGGIAPAFTSNFNQVLDPGKSRQVEFGLKMAPSRDWTLAAALFRIEKPLEYIDSSFTYVRNGEARHTGLELSAQGRLSRNLRMGASLTALRARQSGTGEITLDGKRVTNVPELKSVVYLDYAVPQVRGLALNGSWQYASDKIFTPDNRVSVPSYHLFNLGARYETQVAGKATTLRFGVDNVFDKFYWRDASQQLGGYLFPGAPRIFRLSAQVDF
jgi:iron complex outermembrane receptor protein